MEGCVALQIAKEMGYLEPMEAFDKKSEVPREIVTFSYVYDRAVLKFNFCPFCGTPFTGGGVDSDGVPQCSSRLAPKISTVVRDSING